MRRILLAAIGALTLSVSVVPAAGAAAGTFGADLNHLPPNNTAGDVCSAGIPAYGLPQGSQSCMFTYFGSGADTLFAPVSGTVTAIRVKVGNITGKMRVNVVRFNYYQTGDPSHSKTVTGPYLEAYGPEFTPQANAITQVATRLPVQLDPNPAPGDTSTIQSSDALALEIEAPNVPIPLDSDAAASSLYATYPGPTEQGLQAPSPNAIPNTRQIAGQNLGVLMNADLTTGSPGPSRPAVRLLGGSVPVKHGVCDHPAAVLGRQLRGAGLPAERSVERRRSGAGRVRNDERLRLSVVQGSGRPKHAREDQAQRSRPGAAEAPHEGHRAGEGQLHQRWRRAKSFRVTLKR